ncbi:MAG: YaeQ family protein [Sedimenticolaceae bacterium]
MQPLRRKWHDDRGRYGAQQDSTNRHGTELDDLDVRCRYPTWTAATTKTHNLTPVIPPGTDRRMMVRLLAFALNADEHLAIYPQAKRDDEPDLWHSLNGEITLWVETGQPDEKRIRKGCARSERSLSIASSIVQRVGGEADLGKTGTFQSPVRIQAA